MKRWLTIIVCGVGLSTVSAQCGGAKDSEEASKPAAMESDEEAGFSEGEMPEPAPAEEESSFGMDGEPAVDDTFADPVEPTPEDLGVGEGMPEQDAMSDEPVDSYGVEEEPSFEEAPSDEDF